MRLPKGLLVLSLLQIGVFGSELEATEAALETPSTHDTATEALKLLTQANLALHSLLTLDEESRNEAASSSRGPISSVLRWMKQKSRWKALGGGEGRSGESLALKVVDSLQHAAELGSVDALYKLGDISMFPPSLHLPLNMSRAFDAFSRHGHLTGNTTSRFRAGFFHATGFGGVTPIDQKQALLEWTFSAYGPNGDGGGSKFAQMALGYRYWMGIGVNENCMAALDWYQAAADEGMRKFRQGPPGGRTLPYPAVRLSDLAGGVYGYGSSAASTGIMAARAVIKSMISSKAGEGVKDLIEYFQFNADRNDQFSIYRLGKIYYHGSIYSAIGGAASGGEGVSLVPRDYTMARYYFTRGARFVWAKDHPNKPSWGRRDPNKAKATKTDKKSKEQQKDYEKEVYAARCAGYLGRMFLRGEGVRQDIRLARMWFERGAEVNDHESLNGLGMMYRDGLIDDPKDTAKDAKDSPKAAEYFNLASAQELADAQLNMGKLLYDKGEVGLAIQWFEAAVRSGSPLEAYYLIADIHAENARGNLAPESSVQVSMTTAGSCSIATSFYKVVAERASWDEELVREGNAFWNAATQENVSAAEVERHKMEAMLRWLIAAEMGIEVAQNNVAFLLDSDKSSFRDRDGQDFSSVRPHLPYGPNLTSANPGRVALTYWTRSAAQRNVDALVKVGDYHYYGIGMEVDPANETTADRQSRLEKAANYYQSASETQASALAMWNLGWMHENGMGVAQDFHLAKRYYDLALETNSEAYFPIILSLLKLHIRSIWHALTRGSQREKTILLWNEASDEGWYLGKSKAEMRKKQHGKAEAANGGVDEEDIISWSKRKQEGTSEEADFGPEDYFDAATNRRRDRIEGMDDDDLSDTMLLLTLLIVVISLMYIRTRWLDRQRRQQGEAPPNPPNPPDQPQPLGFVGVL